MAVRQSIGIWEERYKQNQERMLGRPTRGPSLLKGPAGQGKEGFRNYLESHWDFK